MSQTQHYTAMTQNFPLDFSAQLNYRTLHLRDRLQYVACIVKKLWLTEGVSVHAHHTCGIGTDFEGSRKEWEVMYVLNIISSKTRLCASHLQCSETVLGPLKVSSVFAFFFWSHLSISDH